MGATDLAYMMVLFWPAAERRLLQWEVLQRYQATLRELGVDYADELLAWDYRLAVAQCVAHAVEWLVIPEDRVQKRALWMLQLQRSLEAFVELDCCALWRANPPF